ncbi:MAG: hypothetical protein ACJAS4_003525 [Bacteriovoracaceae bacterium]|jgi:hypothetical protein
MKYLLIIFFYSSAYASGDHSAGGKVDLKPWSAITEHSELDGFKMTKKAQENLGVTFTSLSGIGPWKIPKTSLLKIKHSSAVFRRWDGWITIILVKVLEEGEDYFKISSVDLESNDEIAASGVQFLRMTEADLNSDTVDACSH